MDDLEAATMLSWLWQHVKPGLGAPHVTLLFVGDHTGLVNVTTAGCQSMAKADKDRIEAFTKTAAAALRVMLERNPATCATDPVST